MSGLRNSSESGSTRVQSIDMYRSGCEPQAAHSHTPAVCVIISMAAPLQLALPASIAAAIKDTKPGAPRQRFNLTSMTKRAFMSGDRAGEEKKALEVAETMARVTTSSGAVALRRFRVARVVYDMYTNDDTKALAELIESQKCFCSPDADHTVEVTNLGGFRNMTGFLACRSVRAPKVTKGSPSTHLAIKGHPTSAWKAPELAVSCICPASSVVPVDDEDGAGAGEGAPPSKKKRKRKRPNYKYRYLMISADGSAEFVSTTSIDRNVGITISKSPPAPVPVPTPTPIVVVPAAAPARLESILVTDPQLTPGITAEMQPIASCSVSAAQDVINSGRAEDAMELLRRLTKRGEEVAVPAEAAANSLASGANAGAFHRLSIAQKAAARSILAHPVSPSTVQNRLTFPPPDDITARMLDSTWRPPMGFGTVYFPPTWVASWLNRGLVARTVNTKDCLATFSLHGVLEHAFQTRFMSVDTATGFEEDVVVTLDSPMVSTLFGVSSIDFNVSKWVWIKRDAAGVQTDIGNIYRLGPDVRTAGEMYGGSVAEWVAASMLEGNLPVDWGDKWVRPAPFGAEGSEGTPWVGKTRGLDGMDDEDATELLATVAGWDTGLPSMQSVQMDDFTTSLQVPLAPTLVLTPTPALTPALTPAPTPAAKVPMVATASRGKRVMTGKRARYEEDDMPQAHDPTPVARRRTGGKWAASFDHFSGGAGAGAGVGSGVGASATAKNSILAVLKPSAPLSIPIALPSVFVPPSKVFVSIGVRHPMFRAIHAFLRFQGHESGYTVSGLRMFEIRQRVAMSTHNTHFLNVMSATKPCDVSGPMQLTTLHGTAFSAGVAIGMDEHNRGFNSSYSKKNSGVAAFKEGHYTTTSFPYAACRRFAHPDKSGMRTMLVCRVLTVVPAPGALCKATVTLDRPECPTHIIARHEGDIVATHMIRFKSVLLQPPQK